PIDELRERLDAIELEIERKFELDQLARRVSAYVNDKRTELKELRAYRAVIAVVALLCMGFVGLFLFMEIWSGFVDIRTAIGNETILAAYVAASFAFVLGILLVLLRGIFGAIKEAENQPYLPPHLAEIYEVLKKFKDP